MGKYKSGRRREVSIVAVAIVLLVASMAASAAAQTAYEKTVEPSEAMVDRWDFVGASAALAKLKFQDKALLALVRSDADTAETHFDKGNPWA